MSKTITTRISNKTDTEQNWNSVDLVALNGELIVYSTDASHSSPRVKIGDGTTQVKDLPFIGATGDEDTPSVYENLLLNSAAEKTISNGAVMPVICDYGKTLLKSRATRLVLTFEAKSDVATNVDAYPRKNSTALSGMAKTASVTTDWTNCNIVFSLSADSYTAWTIRSSGSVTGGSATATVTVRNIKLVVTESEATTSSAGLMSSTDKSKLDGIEAGANKYTHPTYTARDSGLYKVTVNSTGHVSGATAVTKTDITGLGIPAQDTTYGEATPSKAGLMSSTDKTKLNGIASGATANTGTITAVQANGTNVATSGVANIPAASTSAYGVTKLSSSTSSTSKELAATASAVKAAYDLANTANSAAAAAQSTANGKAPAYQYSTTDLTAGTSNLTTGTLYFVYA